MFAVVNGTRQSIFPKIKPNCGSISLVPDIRFFKQWTKIASKFGSCVYVWEKASRRNFRFHFVEITFLLRQFVQCVKWAQNHVYTNTHNSRTHTAKLKRMLKNHRNEYWIHLFLFTLRCWCVRVCAFLLFLPSFCPCWFHSWFDYSTLYTYKLVERCEIPCFPVEIFIWKSGMIHLKSTTLTLRFNIYCMCFLAACRKMEWSGMQEGE